MSSEEYLIILNDAIYIYNDENKNLTQIYKLILEVSTSLENEKTTVSDFKDDNNYFVLCLVQDYLYFFNNNTKEIYSFNLKEEINGKYYNLIPYKSQNNSLDLIISYISSNPSECYSDFYDVYILKFFHYKITYFSNTNYNISLEKENEFPKNYDSCESYISNIFSTCQFISQKNSLLCIYTVENSKLEFSFFDIENFNKDTNFNDMVQIDFASIGQIKSSLVIDSNKIFLCCNGYSNSENDYITSCFNYDFELMNNSNVFDYSFSDCINFENYYFKETQDYILICNNSSKTIDILKINENNIGKYDEDFSLVSFDICNTIHNFSLIYNNVNDEYCIISDCFTFDG